MSHVQVTVPSLQSRCEHSATAFNLSPGLTEVTLFGGYSEWPSNPKYVEDFTPIANTTVLRFGEYTSCGDKMYIGRHMYVNRDTHVHIGRHNVMSGFLSSFFIRGG